MGRQQDLCVGGSESDGDVLGMWLIESLPELVEASDRSCT